MIKWFETASELVHLGKLVAPVINTSKICGKVVKAGERGCELADLSEQAVGDVDSGKTGSELVDAGNYHRDVSYVHCGKQC